MNDKQKQSPEANAEPEANQSDSAPAAADSQISAIAGVEVDLTAIIGSAFIPIQQLLRMGRGAVIQLDADENSQVTLCANFIPIAAGTITVSDNDEISIQIDRLIQQLPTAVQYI